MTTRFMKTMTEATRLTQNGDTAEATRLIREALSGTPGGDGGTVAAPFDGVTIEGRAMPDLDPKARPADARRKTAPMLTQTYASDAGSRDYRLFLPSGAAEGGVKGLILMLHGCSQDADDFARGTAMNRHGEKHGLAVAYACQTSAHNAHGCWNWFDPSNQRRGEGEPAILAGMARDIARTHAIPEDRIFVAGLSAGGAMAAVLGATYPDVFNAVGVHSGLAAGAADTVMAAFAVMAGRGRRTEGIRQDDSAPAPRVMVIHGTSDSTVAPVNGSRVMEAAEKAHPLARRLAKTHPDGRTAVVRLEMPDGTVVAEHREVTGLAHAWSGGDRSGSFTAPDAPDASAAMVAFFLNG